MDTTRLALVVSFSRRLSTYLLLYQMVATFADDILKRICLNENARISIQFPLKFVPEGPIDNIPALV